MRRIVLCQATYDAPRLLPGKLLGDAFACAIALRPARHPPDRKVGRREGVEVGVHEATKPPAVHSHGRAGLARVDEAPRVFRAKALLAVRDPDALSRVFEH